MRTRWERLGALAVALTLVVGGVSVVGVHPASAAAPIEMRGAEFGAPALYRMQQTTPAASENGAAADAETADATEKGAANGPEAADATENETADGPEAAEDAENEAAEAPGDETVDGIVCEQQGEHEGENEGC